MTTHEPAPTATCGQGLAEHAPLPGKLAELMAAMANNLELHMAALDLGDHNAKREHEAYASLVRQHREIAERLGRISREMAGYRDLPMGRHDANAMSGEQVADAFRDLIALESQSLDSLRRQVDAHRAMLAKMRR
jgi:hypothetical protein